LKKNQNTDIEDVETRNDKSNKISGRKRDVTTVIKIDKEHGKTKDDKKSKDKDELLSILGKYDSTKKKPKDDKEDLLSKLDDGSSSSSEGDKKKKKDKDEEEDDLLSMLGDKDNKNKPDPKKDEKDNKKKSKEGGSFICDRRQR